MGAAAYRRGSELIRRQIDRDIEEKAPAMESRSLRQSLSELHQRINNEREEHRDRAAAMMAEIAGLKQQAAQDAAHIDRLNQQIEYTKGLWKAACQQALRYKKNWIESSQLLRLAGTEAVERLRELRDMHG